MELDSSQQQNSQIHLLPEHLIDQIKAGEVIERPASLIKEIIENSIDAGSTQIDLHLINCGIDLISIIDNGSGMNFEDLPYAFCRHATSKIERFEDLYKLSSFGFRGEALASISAISRLTCTSTPRNQPELGGKIIIHGGQTMAHAQQPGTVSGTSLFIKDLFYNTPARLKFIKSQISEKNALKRIIQSFIVSNPQVNFSIKWDDADKDFYPATGDDLNKRISQVLHKGKKQQDLHHFIAEYEGHTVSVYLTQSSTKGNSYKKQFLFANKRLFTDKQIHQTIIRNCEGLYPQGEMGHYCAFIDVPPNLIDVNVHPNKTQIKFFKLPVITALLSSELKKLKSHVGPIHDQTAMSFTQPENMNTMTEQTIPNHHSSLQDYSSPIHSRPARPMNQQYIASAYQGNTQEGFHQVRSFSSPIQQIEHENKKYLIHKFEFMKYFLGQRNINHTDDLNDYIPLLISSPISLEILENEEEKLNALLKIGLQVERLDAQALVLRSYHKSYQDFPIESFVPLFLKNDSHIGFLKDTSFQFSHKWCLKNLNQLSGVREITPELLKKIFYE